MRVRPRASHWPLWLVPALGLAACGAGEDPPGPARLSLVGALTGADTAGYARALEPRVFAFPVDHGPHGSFRTEWWYVTGNLTSTDGQAFGFQLTIFRSALAPRAPDTGSAFGTNQAFMAHFTVTDIARGRFHAHERFARGAAGLAGATAAPLRVWLEDWELAGAGDDGFPLVLTAREAGLSLGLVLERGKPIVSQGDRGLSRKGPEPGNASFYYSATRLPAGGTLVVGQDTLPVRGAAWLDREWSTSALSGELVGWDWFALQLDDGWDLMAYRLRREDGSADPFSAASLVDPSGGSVSLRVGADVTVEATSTWRSPLDGSAYPSGWTVRIPSRGWDLLVEPRVADQELDGAFRYWEGSVSVRGIGEGGRTVAGVGYAELTGYAEATRDR